MVALNFQPRFADAIECGEKRQTIRRNARCKPGDAIQLYTGQRTKECRKLGEAVCTRVRRVRICATEMQLDGKHVYAGNASRDDFDDCDNDFAKRDGFPGFMEMAEWFNDRYGSLPFEGFVIEWSND
jgi:hypothetical protein